MDVLEGEMGLIEHKFKLILRGHLQLFSPSRSEIAVDGLGEKAKGLLAILATRPGQPIART